MPADRLLDVAIVGAGIVCVIHLHYARQAGLDALVLEARSGIGGLWRELPAWQDIQISAADWAIGDLPLAGPLAPQILDNIQAWVERLALADGIRLHSPVRRARHDGQAWTLDTPQGLVCAPSGGGQRRPQHAADPRCAAHRQPRARMARQARCTSRRRWPAATCWWWAVGLRPST